MPLNMTASSKRRQRPEERQRHFAVWKNELIVNTTPPHTILFIFVRVSHRDIRVCEGVLILRDTRVELEEMGKDENAP
jgi:hypothetical protein